MPLPADKPTSVGILSVSDLSLIDDAGNRWCSVRVIDLSGGVYAPAEALTSTVQLYGNNSFFGTSDRFG
jgi:hypothetical protein